FLLPDETDMEDIYIHNYDLNSAMNGDRVLVRVEKRGEREGRPEGTVVRILERAVMQVVGTFENEGAFGFVIADDKRIPNDIFIPKKYMNGAVTGHKVIAHITK